MIADVEQAEIFLRGVVSLSDTETSYKWWDSIKHKYPDYEWDGEILINKTSDKDKDNKWLELL